MFVTGMGDLNALAGVQNAINVQCNSTARQTKGSDRECCLIFKLPVDLVKMCAIKLAWPCKLVINQARIPPYLPGFGAIDNFMSIFIVIVVWRGCPGMCTETFLPCHTHFYLATVLLLLQLGSSDRIGVLVHVYVVFHIRKAQTDNKGVNCNLSESLIYVFFCFCRFRSILIFTIIISKGGGGGGI